MSSSKVIINGQAYDAITGLKIENSSHFARDMLAEENFTKKKPAKKSEPETTREEKMRHRISAKKKQEILTKKVAAEFANENIHDQEKSENKQKNRESKQGLRAKNSDQSLANGAETTEKSISDQAKTRTEKFATNRTHQKNSRRKLQNSKTLKRKFVRKPRANYQAPSKRKIAVQETAMHPLVHKFDAPRENPIYRPAKKPAQKTLDENDAPAPEIFPEETKSAHENYSGPELAEILFHEKLADPNEAAAHAREAQKSAKMRRVATRKRRLKTSTIMATGLAVLLISGFFAYTQMPNLSVRVAANRAGIEATNPRIPNGYSVNGPVAYSKGTVTINYKNNSGGEGYSVIQEAKSQNSVKELIDPKNEKNYETIKSGDIIIYKSGDRAMWRNGDVIYTIIGDQNLSDNQILEIAVNV